MTSTQKDNIDVILDEQVVLNRNGEVQWFLVHWVGRTDSDCTWITRDTWQQHDPNPVVDNFATFDYVGHAAQALLLVRGLVLVRHVTKSKHLCHL